MAGRQHGTIFDVAEINQQRLLEESEQWLENLVQTYLVLKSGKLLLQKSFVRYYEELKNLDSTSLQETGRVLC